jgi:hypothetical protein
MAAPRAPEAPQAPQAPVVSTPAVVPAEAPTRTAAPTPPSVTQPADHPYEIGRTHLVPVTLRELAAALPHVEAPTPVVEPIPVSIPERPETYTTPLEPQAPHDVVVSDPAPTTPTAPQVPSGDDVATGGIGWG